MARQTLREPEIRLYRDAGERWTQLVFDDVDGIDGDIEELIRRHRATHRTTREEASAALVRRLSSLAHGFEAAA